MNENPITNQYLIATDSYYHDVLTWCVQMKQAINNWRNIFYICRDPVVIVMVILSYHTIVYVGYFLQAYENFTPKWNWWQLYFSGIASGFGFGSEYFAIILSNRIFYCFCLMAALLFFIIGNTFVLVFVTIPLYEDQITTTQEIIQQRFDLVGDSFAFQHLKLQNEVNLN